jgi:hypothetical protein
MLAAGTYRGRLGGQVYQQGDTMGLSGLRGDVPAEIYAGAGPTVGAYAPRRIAMFGRTKLIHSLRAQSSIQEKARILQMQAQATSQFQESAHPPTAAVTLGAVGLGGLCGALLAAALL